MIKINQKDTKLFYYWLLFSFSLIFIMVVVGGLTRLTNSGLSITEWELFTGILPPFNSSEWQNYFNLYKEIPQFKMINPNMSLEEFKVIFYWEYAHRVLGRIIGLFFLLPLIYFYFFSKVSKKYFSICFLIFFLIVGQGIIGWFMVSSGLVNNVTVSHYRLSLHLTGAFIIISIIFWTLLNLKKDSNKVFFLNEKKNYIFYFLFILIFLQLIIGAFVSGLDAGKLYQTWPMMNNAYFPDDYQVNRFKDFFSFDNSSLVQFYHRNLAYLIIIYIFSLGFYIFKNNQTKLYRPFSYVGLFTFVQIFLGIITLVSGLNIYLASAHQIGSLLLVLSVLNLYYNYIN